MAMQVRMFTTNKDVDKRQEVETSKETAHFGTHKDLDGGKCRVVSHKPSGRSLAKFTTMRDAHLFMEWMEDCFGDTPASEIKKYGKEIYAQLHTYPSYQSNRLL